MVRFTKTGYHRHACFPCLKLCVCVCVCVYTCVKVCTDTLLLPGDRQGILETVVSVSCWDPTPDESRLRNEWD